MVDGSFVVVFWFWSKGVIRGGANQTIRLSYFDLFGLSFQTGGSNAASLQQPTGHNRTDLSLLVLADASRLCRTAAACQIQNAKIVLICAAMMTDTILQDQKKRTLDALERRFALADAELHLQKQKNKKRPHEEKGRANIYTLSSSKQQAEVLIPPSSNTSFKKGKFSVSGQTPARDVEANDPVYSQLLHAIDENLAASSKSGSIADWIFNELRQNGDSAQKYMQGSRNMKRDEWILLDNLVQGQGMSGAVQAKALRSFSKRSQKHMSVKQLKKCGSLDLPQELHNFEIFKPMHEMWKGYMKQLLKNVGKNEVAKYLLSADLHGAVILVAECKIAAFTGINGIMVRETAETFGIITQDNKFRVVPKKLSVFILQANSWKITLHGDKLTSRKIGQ